MVNSIKAQAFLLNTPATHTHINKGVKSLGVKGSEKAISANKCTTQVKD